MRVGQAFCSDTTGAGLGGGGVRRCGVRDAVAGRRALAVRVDRDDRVGRRAAGPELREGDVVFGGSTRRQPSPFLTTQYHQVDEPPFAASQASEMLVSELAVIRRFVGPLELPPPPGGASSQKPPRRRREQGRGRLRRRPCDSTSRLPPQALTGHPAIRRSGGHGFRGARRPRASLLAGRDERMIPACGPTFRPAPSPLSSPTSRARRRC